MSTELAVRDTRPDVGVSVIRQTAADLADAHRIGSAIAATSFAPAHFKGKPEECAIAILYGATIGLDPMTAIQQIFVIGGKPALYARAMVAIVLSAGHEVWTEEESPGRVTVCGRRRGSDRVESVTWTTDLARQAGYTSNGQYQKNPRAMLYARASGDVARRVAPDALLGMAHSIEELRLEPARAETARGASILEPATPEPEDPVAEVVAEMVTDAQSRKIGAGMRELGLTDRGVALQYVSGVVGREVPSRSDLTKAEAGALIDRIEADLDTARHAAAETEPDDRSPGVAPLGSDLLSGGAR